MNKSIFSGNELIIQGGLEAGISLYTGYPGSPLADYFNLLYKKRNDLKRKGIRVVIGNSEANAAAMASGAKMAGRNTMVAMKSMGLHVAADALSVGNFADSGKEGTQPGVVVVVGDDPWSISTSTPADSRYLYQHLHIPFLAPANPQELKDWVKKALELSQLSSVYVGLLLTTEMAEGGGRIEVFDEVQVPRQKEELDPSQFNLAKNVMVPPNSLGADRDMIFERFPKIEKILETWNLDKTFGNEKSTIGIVTFGPVSETLLQFINDFSLNDIFFVYKVAVPYPLIEKLIIPILKKLEVVIVIEEKRGFLEKEILKIIGKNSLTCEVYGKNFENQDGFPSYGGIDYDVLESSMRILLDFLARKNLIKKGDDLLPPKFKIDSLKNLPRRLPTFCPGCPHRETLSLLKELRRLYEEKKINLVSHGDVGCYSLSFLPPFREMHDLSAMGQGGAMGAGTDLFTTNPSVVLMGDSTFFHSGISALSNSLQLGHSITYVLLDNGNTAMTGHQMTPVSGVSVDGESRAHQDIVGLVKAMGVETVVEINPSDRYFYLNVLKELVEKKGLKVIISNKECGLTYHGRKRKEERKILKEDNKLSEKEFYQINTDSCEDCRECVELTGCPGLTRVEDAYGSKVQIDPQICVSDSYCTKIKVCPSFEKVLVFDYSPEAKEKSEIKNLPEPKKIISWDKLRDGKDWRIVVTGVGGSGVTTISKVIGAAAKNMPEDIGFKFFDQKGLAQRNGSVTGHLVLSRYGKAQSPITPSAMADVLVSPDLLEGTRAIKFLSQKGMAFIDSKMQIPLSILLDRKKTATDEEIAESIQTQLGSRLCLRNFKEESQRNFGRPIYASTCLLGAMYQAGMLPFSAEDIKMGLKESVTPAELEFNLLAFDLGRKEYLEASQNIQNESPIETLFEKSVELAFGNDGLRIFEEILKESRQIIPEIEEQHFKQYIHDMVVYNKGLESKEFINGLKKLHSLYNGELLQIAVRTWAKTFFIKDEVFIAHQMISPVKKYRDQMKYSHLGKSYKNIFINRPSFAIGPWKLEFDLSPKWWMLAFMKRARFLRALLPSWHKKERSISMTVRNQLLSGPPSAAEEESWLKDLDNIKGYREVRYKNFGSLNIS